MRASSVLEELVKEYQGKVRVVLKHMVVHPDTVTTAHRASCAAAKQGKFTPFYKAFWEKGFGPYMSSQGKDSASMSDANVMAIAQSLGLNVEKLKADMAGECPQVIARDEAELRKFKVNGTPAFFVNGTFIGGGIPKPEFKKIIDKKLEEFQASGVPAADYYDKVIMVKGDREFTTKRKKRAAAEQAPAPGAPGSVPGAGKPG